MPDDERDRAGVIAPPPLIYLGTLLLGMLLNRRFPIPFLPRKVARTLGWPLVVAGVVPLGWFEWAMRHAGTPTNPYKPSSGIVTEGPFRYTRNPAYLSMTTIYAGIAALATGVVGLPLAAGNTGGDPARGHRARGALPGAEVRGRVPALQGEHAALDLGIDA
jgi:protein-S-isoprenylcysteine O-methyltransferase Ste14